MPLPVDISGQRFGSLTAIARTSSGGRTGTWWQLRCDCGEMIDVPLSRLRVPDQDPRAVRACKTCRAKPCAVCGGLFLKAGTAATCGRSACRRELMRARNAEYAARAHQRDPTLRAQHQRERIARIRADPASEMEFRAAQREAAIRYRATLTEAQREAKRLRQRAHYHENRERVRAAYDRWLANMPADQRERIDRQRRRATRRSQAKRAQIRAMQKFRGLMSDE